MVDWWVIRGARQGSRGSNQCGGSITFWCESGSRSHFSSWCGSGARERKFVQIFIFFFSIILQNLFCVIFSVTMREEGLGVRDKVWGMRPWGARDEGGRVRGIGGGGREKGWGSRDEVWGSRGEEEGWEIRDKGWGMREEIWGRTGAGGEMWCGEEGEVRE